MGWEGAPGQSRAAPSHSPQSDQYVPSPNRSQLQTASSYGPVLSPMNKVHGGGINKLPSVNQLVGQPAQHGSSSAPSLGPMGTSSVSRPSTGLSLLRSVGYQVWVVPNGCIYCHCPGPGMLNSHPMQTNGEMNGGHSSQSMVSGSHCTPPPPYNADPSLVR